MDLQFFGANCLLLGYKGTRFIFNDNMAALGAKPVTKAEDVALFTNEREASPARFVVDQPGEYEISDISIMGIAARAHMDEADKKTATMYKVIAGELTALVTGHVYPELSDAQLESIGMVDVMVVPVGGNGYTLDPVGALKLLKAVEPKVVIPTHYADSHLTYPVPQQELDEALKVLAMEPAQRTAKLKLKPADLSDTMQLIVLDRT